MKTYVVDPITKEIVDPETGEVIEDHPIALGKEWKEYSYDEWASRSRADGEVTYRVHDHGLATYVGDPKPLYRSTKIYRSMVRAKLLSMKEKLYALNQKVRAAKADRVLITVLSTINRWCAILGLPKEVAEEASRIARALRDAGLFGPKKVVLAAAAAIAVATEQLGIALSKKEIAERMGVDFCRMMEFVKEAKKLGVARNRPIDPRAFIPRIVGNLGLPKDVELVAYRIVDALKRRGKADGKTPPAIAAAAVYVASIVMNRKRNQDEVAEAAGLSSVSVRNRYRDIVENVEIEVRL